MERSGSSSSTPNDGERDDNHDSGHIVSVLLREDGRLHSSFADLVFAGERIKVGLRRGKFDYASTTGSGNMKPGANGAKKKKGETHNVIAAPTWMNSAQTPHNPMYQYPPHQYHYSANIDPPPCPMPLRPRAPNQL